MQVGEVRVAEDADFEKLKNLCQCHDDWKQDYNKGTVSVWTKANDVSDFKMMKVRGVFKDISAATAYDVLHDPVYRKLWDNNMIESYEICCLNPMNDIGYYALKVPKPLKNRDFVIQRSWLDMGNQYLIVNHSVNHAKLPQKKNFVRGISYITGYHIVMSEGLSRPNQPGCEVTYVTQSDPKGKLPVWVVNKASQIFAPRIMKKLHKACQNYEKWKAKNKPNFKPWIYPDQMELPRVSMDDIQSMTSLENEDVVDETNLREADFKDEDAGE